MIIFECLLLTDTIESRCYFRYSILRKRCYVIKKVDPRRWNGHETRRRIMRFKDGVLYNNVRFADRDIDLVWNADGTRLNKINPFPLT